MNKKGFTLVELIVVIAIIVILAAIAVPAFNGLIDKAAINVDKANAEILGNALRYGLLDGTLIVDGNKVKNTKTGTRYQGTGYVFYNQMSDYLATRIVLLSDEANNSRNASNRDGEMKYYFKISGDNIIIFYNDQDGSDIEIAAVEYQ